MCSSFKSKFQSRRKFFWRNLKEWEMSVGRSEHNYLIFMNERIQTKSFITIFNENYIMKNEN